MKILSNFDTQLQKKLFDEAVHQYGEENVLLVKKSRFLFLFEILLPLVILTIVLTLIRFLFQNSKEDLWDYTMYWFWILASLITMIQIPALLQASIDYYMDFVILTPALVTFYNQAGILNKSSESLESDKIKAVNFSKRGLLQSIANYGEIIFLSEGADPRGDIVFDYARSPEILQKKARRILSHLWESHHLPH